MDRSLYNRIRRGELKVDRFHSPPEHRFWARVRKNGPEHSVWGRCWVWLGPPNHNGYGQFTVGGHNYRPHRYSYELHFGPVPDGLGVLHRCDNPICVNPRHLFAGTALVNQRDKVRKDRQAKGERVSTAILSKADVKEIRRRYKLKRGYHDPVNGQNGLAREFGTSQANISQIIHRQTWSHLR
jgi:hypothetical protein